MGSYYAGIMNSEYARELRHRGIKGQKWGVKNGPPYPLSNNNSNTSHNFLSPKVVSNLRESKVSNLDKWGKDAEHNILYIYGRSGSGKSTTAYGLKKQGDTVISLDYFMQDALPDRYNKEGPDKKFQKYLDKNFPQWVDIKNAYEPGVGQRKSNIDFGSKEYYNLIDKFRNTIDQYSIQQFKDGHRVILEGIQLANGWYTDDYSIYKDKPIVIMNTGPIKSVKQVFAREFKNEPGLLKLLGAIGYVKDFIPYWIESQKYINAMTKSTNSKRNQKYISDFLKGQ